MTADSSFSFDHKRILALLNEKLRLRAPDVQTALRKSGRRLPKDARRAAQVLAQAEMYQAHPKLSRLVDGAAVLKAEARLTEHLEKIDPKRERTDALLRRLGALAFNLLAVVVIFVVVLIWRGFL